MNVPEVSGVRVVGVWHGHGSGEGYGVPFELARDDHDLNPVHDVLFSRSESASRWQ